MYEDCATRDIGATAPGDVGLLDIASLLLIHYIDYWGVAEDYYNERDNPGSYKEHPDVHSVLDWCVQVVETVGTISN